MDSFLKLLGHQELDRQHLELARAVARFSESESQRAMTIALNDFFEIWREHALFEEKLMHQSNYPMSKDHEEVHNEITREISQMFKLAMSEGFPSREAISKKLKYWFHDHLFVHDAPFVEHLANQEVIMPSETRQASQRRRLDA